MSFSARRRGRGQEQNKEPRRNAYTKSLTKPARFATPMSCGRQACAANRESTAGASLLAQIIVGKFASYLLIDGATLSIRHVEYDIEREIKALGQSGLPRADWIAK